MSESKQRDKWNHTAQLLAMTANCNRDRKKKSSPFTSDDFNPYSDQNRKPEKKADISVLKQFVSKEQCQLEQEPEPVELSSKWE